MHSPSPPPSLYNTQINILDTLFSSCQNLVQKHSMDVITPSLNLKILTLAFKTFHGWLQAMIPNILPVIFPPKPQNNPGCYMQCPSVMSYSILCFCATPSLMKAPFLFLFSLYSKNPISCQQQ